MVKAPVGRREAEVGEITQRGAAYDRGCACGCALAGPPDRVRFKDSSAYQCEDLIGGQRVAATLGVDAAWTHRQPSGVALVRKVDDRRQCLPVAIRPIV